jgi:hypothetical protein
MRNQLAIPRKEWPKEIIVEPSRLASGIWGEPEGDINAAYCADIFPKIRTFVHEGQLFTNCGGWSGHEVNCYPLIPESVYQGPEPAQFTYEGRDAVYRGQKVKLGPCVKFAIRDQTPDEWVDLLQRQYAHGGYFAAGKSYSEVLQNFLQRENLPDGERAAIESELARTDLPNTQSEMLKRLSGKSIPNATAKADDINQLVLPGL